MTHKLCWGAKNFKQDDALSGFGVKKKISISETKTNKKHCQMHHLSICGNVFTKLLIQESVNGSVPPQTQHMA